MYIILAISFLAYDVRTVSARVGAQEEVRGDSSWDVGKYEYQWAIVHPKQIGGGSWIHCFGRNSTSKKNKNVLSELQQNSNNWQFT